MSRATKERLQRDADRFALLPQSQGITSPAVEPRKPDPHEYDGDPCCICHRLIGEHDYLQLFHCGHEKAARLREMKRNQ